MAMVMCRWVHICIHANIIYIYRYCGGGTSRGQRRPGEIRSCATVEIKRRVYIAVVVWSMLVVVVEASMFAFLPAGRSESSSRGQRHAI